LLAGLLVSGCGSEPDRDVAPAESSTSPTTEAVDGPPPLAMPEANVEQIHDNERAPLHHAAARGDAALVERLLAAGGPVDPVDQRGDTPLALAVLAEHVEATRVLLDAGADVHHRSEFNTPLLHRAIAADVAPAIVRLLLDDGARVDVRDEEKQTPLHVAAKWGRRDLVEVLLAHGADVNARDRYGVTPLHETCGLTAQHIEIARILLDARADPLAADRQGDTPLDWALDLGDDGVDLVALFRGVPVDDAIDASAVADPPATLPIYHSIENGDSDAVREWIAVGTDVNAVDRDGYAALHYAAYFDRRPIARMLLDAGAEANASTQSRVTPLHVAARRGSADVVRLLLEHGANPLAVDATDATPLELAVRFDRRAVIQLLREHEPEK
jgi:ankyrin repeat protein